jgi:hypothetical protein
VRSSWWKANGERTWYLARWGSSMRRKPSCSLYQSLTIRRARKRSRVLGRVFMARKVAGVCQRIIIKMAVAFYEPIERSRALRHEVRPQRVRRLRPYCEKKPEADELQ